MLLAKQDSLVFYLAMFYILSVHCQSQLFIRSYEFPSYPYSKLLLGFEWSPLSRENIHDRTTVMDWKQETWVVVWTLETPKFCFLRQRHSGLKTVCLLASFFGV
jgi:hypothetical protein